MESRKMRLMKLSAGQEHRHRRREWTCVDMGGRKGGGRTERVPYTHTAAAAVKSLHSCPTLCDHIDSSPPGSPIPGILQARTLEWVAISFSNA